MRRMVSRDGDPFAPRTSEVDAAGEGDAGDGGLAEVPAERGGKLGGKTG